MSLLSRYLDDALKAELSTRATPGGFRLEDVIRSGVRHRRSTVGVYAPDGQSYAVFRELFEPILQHYQALPLTQQSGLACLNPAAVVSTRIRVARNLAGHAFTAGLSKAERLSVEAKIVRACGTLAPRFPGWVRRLQDIPRARLEALVFRRLAFGPNDPFMAAASIHADWPVGRSVFNTRKRQLSVWINEEDHLRVAVVMPGACVAACAEAMATVMAGLGDSLEFCEDERLGYLTSCPSNAGSGVRASFMVDLRLDPLQEPLLARLESAGMLQVRGPSGEHSLHSGGLADVSFRNRVGRTQAQMLQDMALLFKAP